MFSPSDDGFILSIFCGVLLSKGLFLSYDEKEALKSEDEDATDEESNDFFK